MKTNLHLSNLICEFFHFPTDSGDGERVRGLLDALRDHVRGNAPRLCACR
jgi:hypothetical protein